MTPRKFSLAVTMVPSNLNSMTACDFEMAAASASALEWAALFVRPNIFGCSDSETVRGISKYDFSGVATHAIQPGNKWYNQQDKFWLNHTQMHANVHSA